MVINEIIKRDNSKYNHLIKAVINYVINNVINNVIILTDKMHISNATVVSMINRQVGYYIFKNILFYFSNISNFTKQLN